MGSSSSKVKVSAISDLHGFLPEIEPTDLLLIAGDIVPMRVQKDVEKSMEWMFDKDSGEFVKWINGITCKYVICVWGNHDFVGQEIKEIKTDGVFNKPVYFLNNQEIDLTFGDRTIKIWGSPWCKIIGKWAFLASDDDLEKYY